jgi:hypothetical protein
VKCPRCDEPTEVHRISRGAVKAFFCPACDLVALAVEERLTTVRASGPGYELRERKDLDG